MIFRTRIAAWAIAMTPLLVAALPAHAQDDHGHDHGDEPATASGPALPRFAAVSEAFELVGVLDGNRLTLYLDRFADNSPVTNAELELEIGEVKVPVQAHGEGEYDAVLASRPASGVVPVTVTVQAGSETDLLVGELDLHAEATVDTAEHSHGWQEYASWAAAAAVALVLIAWMTRKLRTSRSKRSAGVE
jgi:hypothetical protein